jgi:hypothetical protein
MIPTRRSLIFLTRTPHIGGSSPAPGPFALGHPLNLGNFPILRGYLRVAPGPILTRHARDMRCNLL